MKLVVLLIGLLMTAIGILGVAAPSIPLQIAHSVLTPNVLYLVAAGRVCIGLLLLCVASGSRAPTALRALGVLIVVAGLITPFYGVERSLATLDWLSSQGSVFMRLVMGIAVVIGLFIVHAVAPNRRGA